MGNPTKKFDDFDTLREQFDGDDPIFGALKTGGNGRAGHNERVANTPEWVKDNAKKATQTSEVSSDGCAEIL
jgi:hypothetical protein